MTNSFTEKLLTAKFELGSGNFTEGGNTLTLSGLRMSAQITKAGGVSMGYLSLDIWGMPMKQMNELSTLGMQVILVRRNTITLLAGDASGMSTAFIGTIVNCYANLQGAPDTPMHIDASVLFADAVINVPAQSIKGSASVDTIMHGLADQMKLSYENNGVTTQLSNPYFSGSARDQALACIAGAGCAWNGGDNGVLAIMPKNGSRTSLTDIPLLAPPPDGTMISYPSFTAQGIMVKTLYNPAIQFMGRVKVQSKLLDSQKLADNNKLAQAALPANGIWGVFCIDHALDSMLPGGKWESDLRCWNPAFPMPMQ
jgi:hypothetical protein